MLQWLSAPKNRWEINSEVGSLEGELFGITDAVAEKAFLSFVRYDARLEKKWLSEKLGSHVQRELDDDYITSLQQLDRTDMIRRGSSHRPTLRQSAGNSGRLS
jgi:hypothetical protein